MARKRAAKQEEAGEQEATAAEPTKQEGGEKMTKADAVRAALAEGIEEPEDAVKFIKDRFGIDITRPQFSTTKSLEKKRAGKKTNGRGGRRAGRQPANGTPTVAALAAALPSGNSGLAIQMEALKTLCDQMGVDQVKQIAELFRK